MKRTAIIDPPPPPVDHDGLIRGLGDRLARAHDAKVDRRMARIIGIAAFTLLTIAVIAIGMCFALALFAMADAFANRP